MIVCVDFNGVIEDPKNVIKGKRMGPPMEGALEALEDLYQLHTLIIHTTMANTPSGRKAVEDWLEYFGVEYHDIVPKPKADLYIDDLGYAFKNWEQTTKMLGLE